jgi:hypothetical protein
MTPLPPLFAALVGAIVGAVIVSARPSWAEAVSRAVLGVRGVVTLVALVAGAVALLPRPFASETLVGAAGLGTLMATLVVGMLLFPAETRGGIAITPVKPSAAQAGLVERLQAPWSSLDPETLPAAADLVRCAELVYEAPVEWEESASRLGFSKAVTMVEGSAKGVVLIAGDEAVIAFQGTDGADDIGDWFTNLDTIVADAPADPVHHGFYRAYRSLAPQLETILSRYAIRHVWITGHSLGGAMAVLVALDLVRPGKVEVRGVMTFGQPLLLAPGFAAEANRLLAGRHLRFVNEDDIVPRVVPGLRGGGSTVWFRDGTPTFTPPRMRASATTAAAEAPREDGPAPLSEEEFAAAKARIVGRGQPPAGAEATTMRSLPNATDHAMQRYVEAVCRHFAPGRSALAPR